MRHSRTIHFEKHLYKHIIWHSVELCANASFDERHNGSGFSLACSASRLVLRRCHDTQCGTQAQEPLQRDV